jgi:hypothetical protein
MPLTTLKNIVLSHLLSDSGRFQFSGCLEQEKILKQLQYAVPAVLPLRPDDTTDLMVPEACQTTMQCIVPVKPQQKS